MVAAAPWELNVRDCKTVSILPLAQGSEVLVVIKNFFLFFFFAPQISHFAHAEKSLSPRELSGHLFAAKAGPVFFCQGRTKAEGSAGFISSQDTAVY